MTFDWPIISKLDKGVYHIEMQVKGDRKAITRIENLYWLRRLIVYGRIRIILSKQLTLMPQIQKTGITEKGFLLLETVQQNLLEAIMDKVIPLIV